VLEVNGASLAGMSESAIEAALALGSTLRLVVLAGTKEGGDAPAAEEVGEMAAAADLESLFGSFADDPLEGAKERTPQPSQVATSPPPHRRGKEKTPEPSQVAFANSPPPYASRSSQSQSQHTPFNTLYPFPNSPPLHAAGERCSVVFYKQWCVRPPYPFYYKAH
jgi:hypothetical protein